MCCFLLISSLFLAERNINPELSISLTFAQNFRKFESRTDTGAISTEKYKTLKTIENTFLDILSLDVFVCLFFQQTAVTVRSVKEAIIEILSLLCTS